MVKYRFRRKRNRIHIFLMGELPNIVAIFPLQYPTRVCW